MILALVAALYLTGMFESVELKLMDSRFRLLHWVAPTIAKEDIVLVEIDAKSLQSVGHWPWPRSFHGVLVERLLAAGVKGVAFDLVFSSHQAPQQDDIFARVLEQSPRSVVLAALREPKHRPDGSVELIHTEPLAKFRANAGIASINVHPDADGLVRRMATAYPWTEGIIPSLAAALANLPTIAMDEYWIDYSLDTTTISRLSYVDVLTGSFEPERLKDKVVLVGATALELNDQVQVPLFGAMAGPVLQALASETLKQGPLLRASPHTAIATALAVVLLAGSSFRSWTWRRGLLAVFGLTALLYLLSVGLQTKGRVLMDLAPPVLTLVFTYSWTVFRRIDQQSLNLLLQGVEMRRKDVMMRHIVESSFDGILTIGADGRIGTANAAAERIFGCPSDKIIGHHVGHLFLKDGLPVSGPDHLSSLAAKTGHVEIAGKRKNGSVFPMDIAVSSVVVGDESLLTAVVRDITQRKQQDDALRHQALHDALTGLPNRTLLHDRIEQGVRLCRRSGKRMALLLIDLDRFKEVNDTLGHDVGDILLKGVAARLSAGTRDSDTVARLGGDEFAILLPQIDDLKTAEWLAEIIRGKLQQPFNLQGLTLDIGASIGIALFPEHGTDAADLIKRADVAMYVAKSSLEGHTVYDAEKDHHSVRHLTLSGELRQAIETGQLELHYQPKIDLSRNQICGTEALVRWRHPVHGFMPPDEFIHIAENTGLIGPLTEWVLRTAIAKCRDWHSDNIPIGVAVNLSPRQIHDETLPILVVGLLRESGLPEDALTLEVTESAIMLDPTRAMETIRRLSDAGIKLSIDDFGTGYSSLAYLRDLPATELKIDKSFVQDVCVNESNRKIVHSTINLAHNMGLKVVAEGIEEDDARQFLASAACDIGQGYFFSKPLPADKLADWLLDSPWATGIWRVRTATAEPNLLRVQELFHV